LKTRSTEIRPFILLAAALAMNLSGCFILEEERFKRFTEEDNRLTAEMIFLLISLGESEDFEDCGKVSSDARRIGDEMLDLADKYQGRNMLYGGTGDYIKEDDITVMYGHYSLALSELLRGDCDTFVQSYKLTVELMLGEGVPFPVIEEEIARWRFEALACALKTSSSDADILLTAIIEAGDIVELRSYAEILEDRRCVSELGQKLLELFSNDGTLRRACLKTG